jgi:hypothetical protein
MRRVRHRWSTSAVLVTCLALALGATADAAAPRVIVIDAGGGEHFIFDDWDENAALFAAIVRGVQLSRQEVRANERPSLRIVLFWRSAQAAKDLRAGRSLDDIIARAKLADSGQEGRFFPAFDRLPAAIELPLSSGWPRQVSPKVLSVFRKHGVPTSVEQSGGGATVWILAIAGGALALGLAAAVTRRQLRQRTV